MRAKILLLILLGMFAFVPIHHFFRSAQAQKVNDMNDNKRNIKTATFAGGCFWCLEADLEKIEGVELAISGYTGGHVADPTYEQVSSGSTGHFESVRVYYDADVVSYEQLLDAFWTHVNPTDPGGQFVDRGDQYRSAVFYHNEEQRRAAEASKKFWDESGWFDKPIVTIIQPVGEFYEAEEYHQDYYQKNPIRYGFYRRASGRDSFLDEVKESHADIHPSYAEAVKSRGTSRKNHYEKPSDEVLKDRLTPLQYQVTQHEGTEPAFRNKYWDNKEDGIYVDIVSGEPLFASTHKYKSGTGWPSFFQPLAPENIVEKKDRSLFMTRTEVRSKHGDSHLGHVFEDGPDPTGLRYCINSAALRFIPREEMVKEGYGDYLEFVNR